MHKYIKNWPAYKRVYICNEEQAATMCVCVWVRDVCVGVLCVCVNVCGFLKASVYIVAVKILPTRVCLRSLPFPVGFLFSPYEESKKFQL